MAPHQQLHFRTRPVAKVFALCVRFVIGGRAGGRAATMVRVRRGRGAGDDIRIGIPVQHIRLRAVLIRRVRATRDEALPGGRQRGHTSSHHHRGTVRSAVRPAAFMHHYTWYLQAGHVLNASWGYGADSATGGFKQVQLG